ncbi:MAG TPA: DUF58 domain-containing protein, partial [Egibacteraceae bacterium]|nr:DUF58 domain-containing protein [Egibacteraceae bacterium]
MDLITPRGLALLGCALLAWLVGRLLGVAELYVAAASAGALVAAGAIAVRVGSESIAVRRGLTTRFIHHGGSAEVLLTLRNDARLAAPLLLVEDAHHRALAPPARFVVPGLVSGRSVTLRYRLHGATRGRFTVGPVRITVRDPFGATQRVRRYSGCDRVVVYPRIEPLGTDLPRGAHQGSRASPDRRVLLAGDEFYTMREYVTGDDLRLVHWPSTAHRARLMVRQHEQFRHAQATVLCDARAAAHVGAGADSTLEKSVSAAASVVWHLADRGYQLRLVTVERHGPAVIESRQALLARLAELRPSRAASLAPALAAMKAQGGEGVVVAVVAPPPGGGPPTRHPDVRALLGAGRSFSDRVALVVAGRDDDRAQVLAALLVAAGWRAVTVSPSDRLADRWALVAGARRGVAAPGT